MQFLILIFENSAKQFHVFQFSIKKKIIIAQPSGKTCFPGIFEFSSQLLQLNFWVILVYMYLQCILFQITLEHGFIHK